MNPLEDIHAIILAVMLAFVTFVKLASQVTQDTLGISGTNSAASPANNGGDDQACPGASSDGTDIDNPGESAGTRHSESLEDLSSDDDSVSSSSSEATIVKVASTDDTESQSDDGNDLLDGFQEGPTFARECVQEEVRQIESCPVDHSLETQEVNGVGLNELTQGENELKSCESESVRASSHVEGGIGMGSDENWVIDIHPQVIKTYVDGIIQSAIDEVTDFLDSGIVDENGADLETRIKSKSEKSSPNTFTSEKSSLIMGETQSKTEVREEFTPADVNNFSEADAEFPSGNPLVVIERKKEHEGREYRIYDYTDGEKPQSDTSEEVGKDSLASPPKSTQEDITTDIPEDELPEIEKDPIIFEELTSSKSMPVENAPPPSLDRFNVSDHDHRGDTPGVSTDIEQEQVPPAESNIGYDQQEVNDDDIPKERCPEDNTTYSGLLSLPKTDSHEDVIIIDTAPNVDNSEDDKLVQDTEGESECGLNQNPIDQVSDDDIVVEPSESAGEVTATLTYDNADDDITFNVKTDEPFTKKNVTVDKSSDTSSSSSDKDSESVYERDPNATVTVHLETLSVDKNGFKLFEEKLGIERNDHTVEREHEGDLEALNEGSSSLASCEIDGSSTCTEDDNELPSETSLADPQPNQLQSDDGAVDEQGAEDPCKGDEDDWTQKHIIQLEQVGIVSRGPEASEKEAHHDIGEYERLPKDIEQVSGGSLSSYGVQSPEDSQSDYSDSNRLETEQIENDDIVIEQDKGNLESSPTDTCNDIINAVVEENITFEEQTVDEAVVENIAVDEQGDENSCKDDEDDWTQKHIIQVEQVGIVSRDSWASEKEAHQEKGICVAPSGERDHQQHSSVYLDSNEGKLIGDVGEYEQLPEHIEEVSDGSLSSDDVQSSEDSQPDDSDSNRFETEQMEHDDIVIEQDKGNIESSPTDTSDDVINAVVEENITFQEQTVDEAVVENIAVDEQGDENSCKDDEDDWTQKHIIQVEQVGIVSRDSGTSEKEAHQERGICVAPPGERDHQQHSSVYLDSNEGKLMGNIGEYEQLPEHIEEVSDGSLSSDDSQSSEDSQSDDSDSNRLETEQMENDDIVIEQDKRNLESTPTDTSDGIINAVVEENITFQEQTVDEAVVENIAVDEQGDENSCKDDEDDWTQKHIIQVEQVGIVSRDSWASEKEVHQERGICVAPPGERGHQQHSSVYLDSNEGKLMGDIGEYEQLPEHIEEVSDGSLSSDDSQSSEDSQSDDLDSNRLETEQMENDDIVIEQDKRNLESTPTDTSDEIINAVVEENITFQEQTVDEAVVENIAGDEQGDENSCKDDEDDWTQKHIIQVEQVGIVSRDSWASEKEVHQERGICVASPGESDHQQHSSVYLDSNEDKLIGDIGEYEQLPEHIEEVSDGSLSSDDSQSSEDSQSDDSDSNRLETEQMENDDIVIEQDKRNLESSPTDTSDEIINAVVKENITFEEKTIDEAFVENIAGDEQGDENSCKDDEDDLTQKHITQVEQVGIVPRDPEASAKEAHQEKGDYERFPNDIEEVSDGSLSSDDAQSPEDPQSDDSDSNRLETEQMENDDIVIEQDKRNLESSPTDTSDEIINAVVEENVTFQEKTIDEAAVENIPNEPHPKRIYTDEDVRKAIRILTSRPPYDDETKQLYGDMSRAEAFRVFALVLAPNNQESRSRVFGLYSNSDTLASSELLGDFEGDVELDSTVELIKEDKDFNKLINSLDIPITAISESKLESKPDVTSDYSQSEEEEEDVDDSDTSSSASSGMYIIQDYPDNQDQLESRLTNNVDQDYDVNVKSIPSGRGFVFCVTANSGGSVGDVVDTHRNDEKSPNDHTDEDSDVVALNGDVFVETERRILHLSEDRIEYDTYLVHRVESPDPPNLDSEFGEDVETESKEDDAISEDSNVELDPSAEITQTQKQGIHVHHPYTLGEDQWIEPVTTDEERLDLNLDTPTAIHVAFEEVLPSSHKSTVDNEFDVPQESHPREYSDDTNDVEAPIIQTETTIPTLNPSEQMTDDDSAGEVLSEDVQVRLSFTIETPTRITFEESVLPEGSNDNIIDENIKSTTLDPNVNTRIDFDALDNPEGDRSGSFSSWSDTSGLEEGEYYLESGPRELPDETRRDSIENPLPTDTETLVTVAETYRNDNVDESEYAAEHSTIALHLANEDISRRQEGKERLLDDLTDILDDYKYDEPECISSPGDIEDESLEVPHSVQNYVKPTQLDLDVLLTRGDEDTIQPNDLPGGSKFIVVGLPTDDVIQPSSVILSESSPHQDMDCLVEIDKIHNDDLVTPAANVISSSESSSCNSDDSEDGEFSYQQLDNDIADGNIGHFDPHRFASFNGVHLPDTDDYHQNSSGRISSSGSSSCSSDDTAQHSGKSSDLPDGNVDEESEEEEESKVFSDNVPNGMSDHLDHPVILQAFLEKSPVDDGEPANVRGDVDEKTNRKSENGTREDEDGLDILDNKMSSEDSGDLDPPVNLQAFLEKGPTLEEPLTHSTDGVDQDGHEETVKDIHDDDKDGFVNDDVDSPISLQVFLEKQPIEEDSANRDNESSDRDSSDKMITDADDQDGYEETVKVIPDDDKDGFVNDDVVDSPINLQVFLEKQPIDEDSANRDNESSDRDSSDKLITDADDQDGYEETVKDIHDDDKDGFVNDDVDSPISLQVFLEKQPIEEDSANRDNESSDRDSSDKMITDADDQDGYEETVKVIPDDDKDDFVNDDVVDSPINLQVFLEKQPIDEDSANRDNESSDRDSSDNSDREDKVNLQLFLEKHQIDEDSVNSVLSTEQNGVPETLSEFSNEEGGKDGSYEDPSDLNNPVNFQVFLEKPPISEQGELSSSNVDGDNICVNRGEDVGHEQPVEAPFNMATSETTAAKPAKEGPTFHFNMYLGKAPIDQVPEEYDEYLETGPREPPLDDVGSADYEQNLGEDFDDFEEPGNYEQDEYVPSELDHRLNHFEKTITSEQSGTVESSFQSIPKRESHSEVTEESDTTESDDMTPPRGRVQSSSAPSDFSDAEEENVVDRPSVVFGLFGKPSCSEVISEKVPEREGSPTVMSYPIDEEISDDTVEIGENVEFYRDDAFDEVETRTTSSYAEISAENDYDSYSNSNVVYYEETETTTETTIEHHSVSMTEVEQSLVRSQIV